MSRPHSVSIAIVGTGFSGLGAASTLLREGHTDVLLLERSSAIGGTWRDNTYPGAACDIASHLYSFSFALNPEWSHHYARQPEIRAYLERFAREEGLIERTWVDAGVEEARWQDGRWTLLLADGRSVSARYVVFAVGGLKDPRFPSLPGLDRFEGPVLHSARWQSDADLTGRVGVIGTGASAIQLVPELAKQASQLTVFQRTPPWVSQRGDAPISEADKERYRRQPWRMRLRRAKIYARQELRYPLLFGAARGVGGRIAAWWMGKSLRAQVADPELQTTLTPRYEVGCKRVLLSDDWYPTLCEDHVHVEPSSIEEVLPHGVRLAGGAEVPLDALVCCTGFAVDEPLGTMRVLGTEGRALTDFWGGRPRGYLGMTVPGFPNSFMLLGPNTALGHNSVVVMIEAQLRYVRKAIAYAEQERVTLDVEPAALDAFVRAVNRAHEGQVWTSGCASWYLNAERENFTIWPGSTMSYIARTWHFDPSVYRKAALP